MLLLRLAAHKNIRRLAQTHHSRLSGNVPKHSDRNAIAGRCFPSWEAFEAHLEAWTRDVADVRVHGTTGEAPIERFRRAEAQALKPIAGMPPFQAARELIRRVQSDCAVEIDGNAYSVPWRLIGEMVRATIMDGTVRIHHGLHEVAVHPICAGRRRRVIDAAHFEGLTGFRPSRAGELALSPIAPPAPALLRPLGPPMSDVAFRHLVLAKWLTPAQAPDPFAPLPTHPHRPTLCSSANFLSLPRLRHTTRPSPGHERRCRQL